MAPKAATSLIGGQKTAVRQLQKNAFQPRVKQNEFTSLFGDRAVDVLEELEIERTKVTTELNKLVFALEDVNVPMDEKEVLEVNDEANRKLQLKFSIEKDIASMSRGERDYIAEELKGNLGEYRWFGRAKRDQAVNANSAAEAARALSGVLAVVEQSRVLMIEEAMKKAEGGLVRRGRFDLGFQPSSDDSGAEQSRPTKKRKGLSD